MEAEDPLSQLADIHLPGDVSLWPLAPGWWLLLLVCVILLLWLFKHIVATLVKKRKLAKALAELEISYMEYKTKEAFDNLKNKAALELLQNINALLKRVALIHYPAQGVENLVGIHWLQFLDIHGGNGEFTQGPGMVLSDGVYKSSFNGDADALNDVVKDWIELQYMGKGKTAVEQGSVAA